MCYWKKHNSHWHRNLCGYGASRILSLPLFAEDTTSQWCLCRPIHFYHFPIYFWKKSSNKSMTCVIQCCSKKKKWEKCRKIVCCHRLLLITSYFKLLLLSSLWMDVWLCKLCNKIRSFWIVIKSSMFFSLFYQLEYLVGFWNTRFSIFLVF